MRYLRNEARDAFYEKNNANALRKKKTVKFAKEPWNYVEAKAYGTVTASGPTSTIGTCVWCGTNRSVDEFVKVKHQEGFTIHWVASRRNPYETNTTNICIHCLCRMFEEWKKIYNLSDVDALYMVCAFSNVYFDRELFEAVLKDDDPRFNDDIMLTNDVHVVDRYMRKIEDKYPGPTNFWGSDCSPLNFKRQMMAEEALNDNASIDEDRDNYNIIWSMYHYDPFETEEAKDQKRLRANLVTMIDDAMSGDLVRMNAALEIVKAYYRIEKIGETLNQLQATPELTTQNSNAIKTLTATKSQETAMVTAFSKDHGFAAKYATAKSKGSGTLSAVIRDMKDSNYDPGTVNKYDIETSAAIRQVSDISAESIFKQIAFTSAEYADMVREQAEAIKKLTAQLKSKEEELRLFKEKEVKQELLEELKQELEQKGIPTENVEQMLQKEYTKNKAKSTL